MSREDVALPNLPESLEPIRRHFRIPHRVRDVPVAQVLLNRPCVAALVRQLEPAGLPEHVRVHRGTPDSPPRRARHDLPHCRGGERSTTLRGERVRRRGIVSLAPPEGAHLRAADRMGGRDPVLQTGTKGQDRQGDGRFAGARLDVESVPRLPTFPVRWTLEDPRGRPSFVFWTVSVPGIGTAFVSTLSQKTFCEVSPRRSVSPRSPPACSRHRS